MKDAKFNPIPENAGMSIGYNPAYVAAMSREDFGKSSAAANLAYGVEGINEATRNKWLDAWHEDAKRLAPDAVPAAPAKETKTK